MTAIEETKLLKIARSDFFQIIRNEPPLAAQLLWSFLQVLSERLRTTSEELSGARSDGSFEDLTEELFDIDFEEPEE